MEGGGDEEKILPPPATSGSAIVSPSSSSLPSSHPKLTLRPSSASRGGGAGSHVVKKLHSASGGGAHSAHVHVRHPSLDAVNKAYTFRAGHSDSERKVGDASVVNQSKDWQFEQLKRGRLKNTQRQNVEVPRAGVCFEQLSLPSACI